LCRARSGAPPSALQAIEKAIEVAPDFAQAWSERGSLLRELHQLDEAARSFEKAIALGADPELHAFYLAAVRKSATGTEPPHRYIESLFDDYANDFEEHLVGNLKYQGYELLIRPLLSSRRRYARVLDLGCGTGLCGKLIHTLADQVDGVDLSRAMLERARQTGFYHELTHADIGEYLATATLCEDLVLAADVFGYLRDLRPIFQSVRRILAPNGCFAFTVELSKSGDAIELLPSLRHTHSESYIRRTAEDCGFRILNLTTAALREDQRDPIAALYVYLE
jgi:predicted TPR repeat methyltransferase